MNQSNHDVFAYEILYRNSNENFFPNNVNDDFATAKMFFDTLIFFGVDKLVNNKKAFINLSTNSILGNIPQLLAPKDIVLEITERTEKLNSVLGSMLELKAKGYVFALDDYDGDSKWDALLEHVHFIKLAIYDDLKITINNIIKLKKRFPNKFIIVERIEDYDTFELVKNAGADYFQGYYFAKPKVINFKGLSSSQFIVLELMSIALKTPFDFDELIKKVMVDAGLVSRILKLSNNICKTSKTKISSISQAIIYLGEDAIKQFVTILSLGELGSNKPSELLRLGLIRAQFIALLLYKETENIIKADI